MKAQAWAVLLALEAWNNFYYSSKSISCFLAFFSVWAVLLALPFFCGVGSAIGGE
ncbi:hypothetical protein ACR9KN_04760 [Helicobacter pylori]